MCLLLLFWRRPAMSRPPLLGWKCVRADVDADVESNIDHRHATAGKDATEIMHLPGLLWLTTTLACVSCSAWSVQMATSLSTTNARIILAQRLAATAGLVTCVVSVVLWVLWTWDSLLVMLASLRTLLLLLLRRFAVQNRCHQGSFSMRVHRNKRHLQRWRRWSSKRLLNCLRRTRNAD